MKFETGIVLLIFATLFCFMMIIVTSQNKDLFYGETTQIDVPCYDKYNNIIQDVVCTEDVTPISQLPFYIFFVLITITGIIFMFGD